MEATATREYELVLMLDPEVPDERRDQIVAEARSRIESAGTIKHDTAWGTRKMAFEIRQRTEADYRFFRFVSAPPLLESLDHELKIADGVLRFRIFTVDPRSPVIAPPAPTPGGAPPRAPRREDGDGDAPSPAAEEAPPSQPAPAAESPAPPPETPEPAAETAEAAPEVAEAAPAENAEPAPAEPAESAPSAEEEPDAPEAPPAEPA